MFRLGVNNLGRGNHWLAGAGVLRLASSPVGPELMPDLTPGRRLMWAVPTLA